jgi:hypothetical protein
VDKKQDDLARAALERSVSYKELGENFAQQVADQKLQVESLKTALGKLDQKLAKANGLCHRSEDRRSHCGEKRLHTGDPIVGSRVCTPAVPLLGAGSAHRRSHR